MKLVGSSSEIDMGIHEVDRTFSAESLVKGEVLQKFLYDQY